MRKTGRVVYHRSRAILGLVVFFRWILVVSASRLGIGPVVLGFTTGLGTSPVVSLRLTATIRHPQHGQKKAFLGSAGCPGAGVGS